MFCVSVMFSTAFSVCEDTDSSQRGEGCSTVKGGVLFHELLALSHHMAGNQGVILGN